MSFEIVDELKGKKKKWKDFIKHNPDDINCLHCKYDEREKSIPNQVFKVKKMDGTVLTVNKITVKYGSHDDVVGWTF